MTALRFVVWAAVSSKPQTETDSLPDQLRDGKAFCEAIGGRTIAELSVPGHTRSYIFYQEAAAEMEAYRMLFDLCQRRAFDVLWCRSRDRLGRTDALVAQVEALVNAAGARVYSAANPIQLNLPSNEGEIFGSAWERARAQADVSRLKGFHERYIRSRVRAGKPAARVPYGYLLAVPGKNPVVEIVPEKAAVVKEIYALYLRGWGLLRIANQLTESGIPSPSGTFWRVGAISRTIRNPFYAGYTYWGWKVKDRLPDERIIADGNHEAIIDADQWRAVEAERNRRLALHSRGQHSKRLFTGVAYCARCGRQMMAGTKPSGGPYYRCSTYTNWAFYRAEKCHSNYMPDHRLLKGLRGGLAILKSEEALSTVVADIQAQQSSPDPELIATTERELATIAEERKRLTVAYARAQSLSVDEFEAAMAENDTRRTGLEHRLSELRRSAQAPVDAETIAARLRILSGLDLDSLDPQEGRAILSRSIPLWCENSRIVKVQFL